MLNGGICNFDMFGCKTTKKVQGIRKIALKKLNVCVDGA